jgi:hypothetical protein
MTDDELKYIRGRAMLASNHSGQLKRASEDVLALLAELERSKALLATFTTASDALSPLLEAARSVADMRGTPDRTGYSALLGNLGDAAYAWAYPGRAGTAEPSRSESLRRACRLGLLALTQLDRYGPSPGTDTNPIRTELAVAIDRARGRSS